MAGVMKPKSSDEKVKLYRDRLEQAEQYDRQNRDDAASDMRFLAGDQWPDAARKAREADNRPVITVNKLGPILHQVANDLRQNSPSIKVFPVDDQSDPMTAKTYDGIIRQIEYRSSAQHVYSAAGSHAAACGIGHFRVITDYCDDTTFEQEILIRRIPNPLNVLWDPAAVMPDRSDANWCFVVEPLPREEFKRRYPDAKEVSANVSQYNQGSQLYWATQDYVLVAEYWEKVPTKRKLAMLETGETLDITDLNKFQMSFLPKIVKERVVNTFKIQQSIVTGAEVLEGPNDWAGKYIPVVSIVGGEIPLNNGVVRHGVIRFAKDPQRLYNYWRTAAAESIALAPKAPWLVTPDMIKKHKGIWDTANTTARPYLVYDPDPDAPGAAPRREAPADAPAALWQEGALASDDLKATTGIYDASLGARSNETSGKAIMARQREGDIANFHYSDNLRHSLSHAGRILIDLIPKIYDTARIVRILGEDGTEDFVPINHPVMTADGHEIILNDLSVGRFDVRVSIGPSYTSRRVEAADSMMQFIQAFPQAGQVAGDLLAKNMDWPGAEELAERLKMLIPPEMRGEQPEQQQQPDPMQNQAQQLNMASLEADVRKKHAEADKVDLENLARQVQMSMFQ